LQLRDRLTESGIAGLIYLDAGYSYVYYDRSCGDLGTDLIHLQKSWSSCSPVMAHKIQDI
jgi:hypothetical protein